MNQSAQQKASFMEAFFWFKTYTLYIYSMENHTITSEVKTVMQAFTFLRQVRESIDLIENNPQWRHRLPFYLSKQQELREVTMKKIEAKYPERLN